MQKIHALIFDMDGLIIDSERIVKRAWKLTGPVIGYEGIEEHIYPLLGANVKKREAYFKAQFGEEFPMEEFANINRNFFYDIVEKEGLPLKPGVVELMEEAKKRGLRIGLATSSRREYAVDVLNKVGIWKYFDGAVFGDQVTKAKPDPEIYLLACGKVGVDPANALAFEDAPAGVRAASAAGMRVIMVPDLVQPDEEIQKLYYKKVETLHEALPLLDELC